MPPPRLSPNPLHHHQQMGYQQAYQAPAAAAPQQQPSLQGGQAHMGQR